MRTLKVPDRIRASVDVAVASPSIEKNWLILASYPALNWIDPLRISPATVRPGYAHGAAGVLEAYAKIRDQNHAEECLRLLSQDSKCPMIRSALRQKPYLKGHSPCFCSSGDKFRRCHSAALKGALQLQRDLNALGIVIPQTVRRGVQ